MTVQIAGVLAILLVAVVLFVTERVRMDLVALMVMGCLALTGLVTPADALSGFSNPAVVTVWAVFILSGSLSRTGVANIVGRHVLRLAGESEIRLVTVIMVTAGAMSAFMNNVGVAALLLPVVMDIARRVGRPPSKLLMPLAFGSLLGGLTTLIGTPPNILISDALRDAQLQPFRLFDFAPVGVVVMLTGVAFMALVGRHFLPVRDVAREGLRSLEQTDFRNLYDLRERLCIVRVPHDSALVGRTLAESRLGSSLGLNVIALMRPSRTQLAPGPSAALQPGDRLLVEGRLERLAELRGRQHLVIESGGPSIDQLIATELHLVRLKVPSRSRIVGQTLLELDFHHRYGVSVLAIARDSGRPWTGLDNTPLQAGDVLLAQGPREAIAALDDLRDFEVDAPDQAELHQLHKRLMVVRVTEGSALCGKTVAESRMGDVFGIAVLGVVQPDPLRLVPPAQERFQAGDELLVKGEPADLSRFQALQDLELDQQPLPDLDELESEAVGLVEAILSPHTTLVGKTLRQIHFREKYGLNVLAVWREGRAYRSNLRDMELRFGDALLLYGPRDRQRMLGSEPDFLVLTEAAQEKPLSSKAPVAALVMGAVLLPVLMGWLPISIAAVVGGTLMVLTGCLTMEEAYRFSQRTTG